jgi:poly(3-hydroxybutyrate) depolymerase
MSYGGIMSNNIGCQMGDVFRAIAPIAGSLFGRTSCVNHPVAAWMTHGTADMDVAISGAEAARDAFRTANHCTTTTMPTEPSPCVTYQGCDAGYPVVWCVHDGGHTIPAFSAEAIANFFRQF